MKWITVRTPGGIGIVIGQIVTRDDEVTHILVAHNPRDLIVPPMVPDVCYNVSYPVDQVEVVT